MGLASTSMALAGIAIALSTLGIPIGLQRLLGRARAENNPKEFQRYLNASMLTVGVSVAGIGIFLAATGGMVARILNLPYNLLLAAILIVVASGLASTLSGVFIAALQVKTLLIVQVVSSTLRIASGVGLILIGLGALGVLIGNLVLVVVSFSILGISTLLRSRAIQSNSTDASIGGTVRELLASGYPRWIPGILNMVGIQLGVIVVFGASGAFEAGLYFVALAIASIITGMYTSIMGIAFPILSGMREGRKKLAWRIIRISMVVIAPLVMSLAVYPKEVLGIFGSDYVAAETIVVVLLLSSIPLIISTGVYTLVYAYGNYRQVLAIGLAGSTPSVILYFILTPIFGGIGASYAYLGGTLAGLIVALIIARRVSLRIVWLDVVKATSIPLSIGVLAGILNLQWFLGGGLIFLGSGLGYAKLNLVTRQDLRDLGEAILPKRLTEVLYRRFSWILGFLYKK